MESHYEREGYNVWKEVFSFFFQWQLLRHAEVNQSIGCCVCGMWNGNLQGMGWVNEARKPRYFSLTLTKRHPVCYPWTALTVQGQRQAPALNDGVGSLNKQRSTVPHCDIKIKNVPLKWAANNEAFLHLLFITVFSCSGSQGTEAFTSEVHPGQVANLSQGLHKDTHPSMLTPSVRSIWNQQLTLHPCLWNTEKISQKTTPK